MIIQKDISDYLVKTYSNKNLRIRKKGTEEIYDNSIDLKELNIEYEETDIPIEDDDSLISEYAEAGRILMDGGE